MSAVPSADGAGAPARRSEPSSDPIDALLEGSWIDPDTGRTAGVAIETIAIEDSLRGHEADLVAPLRLGARLAVVSDTVTREVMGERIERALARMARIDPVVLPRDPHADAPTVEAVRAASASADALVAVGSGTINDLAKFAAARDGKPYAVFATAPSMNGYASANAAITVDGHKKTLPAALARGIFVDLSVLAAAPLRMIRAGLGDSLCRPTAQVDWLLSHHVLGTPYRLAPFALLARDEAAMFDAPEALVAGDLAAVRALARTLVLSGIGMTLCGGSYPASQGEHLVSHYLDMRETIPGAGRLHGEQVAVATIAMARIQEAMLGGPAPVLRPTSTDEHALREHFGDELGSACWREFAPKRLDAARARELSERVAARWPEVRRQAASVALAADRLASVMRRAGGPVAPADIGVDASTWTAAVRHARFLRDRYTFLDLADDAGALAALLR